MKHSLLIVSILVFCLLGCGCTASNQNALPSTGSSQNALPSSKYVALYEEVDDEGQIVSGNLSPVVGDAYPPITFYYNKSAAPPSGFPYPINDSLKILFGTYSQKESSAGLRNGLNVVEIYNFPSIPEQGLIINGVDKNGTVDMIYNNTSVALSPGSAWTAPPIPEWNETNTVTYTQPNVNGQSNRTNYTYTIQYNRTVTIENKGVIDK